MDKRDKLYKGFISYSHADKAIAAKLLKKLQTYRLPTTLTDECNRSLGQFFMDRDSLPVAESLSDAIVKGLSQSENLIVLCSPDAVASKWVSLEIETFRKVNPSGSVFAVVLSGNPAAIIGPGASFPAAIRHGGKEPLAADFRREADGPKLGFLKLAAALSDTRLEDLLGRDHRRTRRRVTAITVAAGAVALSMSLLAVMAISARQEAEARQADAEGLVDFMLTELRPELEKVGRLDILEKVEERAQLYSDSQETVLSDCSQLVRKAKALQLESRVDLQKSRWSFAEKSAMQSLKLLESIKDKCQGSLDFHVALGHGYYWAAAPSYKKAEKLRVGGAKTIESYRHLIEASLEHYKEYQLSISPIFATSQQEIADTEINFGSAYLYLGEFDRADDHFLRAENAILQLVNLDGDNPPIMPITPQSERTAIATLANVVGWRAAITEDYRQDYSTAIDMRNFELRLYERLIGSGNKIHDWQAYHSALTRMFSIIKLEQSSGKVGGPHPNSSMLLERADKLQRHDPSNEEWAAFYRSVKQYVHSNQN